MAHPPAATRYYTVSYSLCLWAGCEVVVMLPVMVSAQSLVVAILCRSEVMVG